MMKKNTTTSSQNNKLNTEYRDSKMINVDTWKIPFVTLKSSSSISLFANPENANNFLNHWETQMKVAVKNKEFEKASAIGEGLIFNSLLFRVYVFNKIIPDWYYKYSKEHIDNVWNKLDEDLKNMNLHQEIRRIYIPKNNNKVRPIGVPSLSARVLLGMIETNIRLIVEPQIGKYQHGFVSGRGTKSCSLELINKLRNDHKVFQFDLEAFFNTVNYRLVIGRLKKFIGEGFGNWLLGLTLMSLPILPNNGLMEEKELFIRDNKLYRRGFTQGSPISPLLCIYALEWAGFGDIEGILMYADDGLILRKKEENIELESIKSRLMGIKIAKDKAYGWSNKFKFLGLEYDTTAKTVSYKDIRINYMNCSDKELDMITSYVQDIDITPKEWNLNENSYLVESYGIKAFWKDENLHFLSRIWGMTRSLLWGAKSHSNTRLESTIMCSEILLKKSISKSNTQLINRNWPEDLKNWEGSVYIGYGKYLHWTNETWAKLGTKEVYDKKGES